MKTAIEQYILIAAIIKAVTNKNIGKMLSMLTILAPPFHGNRIRSWKVKSILSHTLLGILLQLTNLKQEIIMG
jgi:hypothetical protein